MHKNFKKYISVIVAVILFSCTLSGCNLLQVEVTKLDNNQSVSSDNSGSAAQFHFIDVGQGDSILIQSENTNILIDAGTYESGHIVYNYLKSLNIKFLDYFIGTHPHEDHLGGASSVLNSIDVGTVFVNNDTSTGYFYERFIDTLINKNINTETPDMDCIYETGPFRLRFLSPTKNYGNANDNSLVVMLQFGDIKALFTGDSERAVEATLLKSGYNLKADILKVGHHGSRYASSQEFLNAVRPSVSVIQCGEGNSYGHPHDETIKRIKSIKSEILRTDKDKTIILTTDGKSIQTKSGKSFDVQKEAEEVKLIYIGNKKSKIFHTEACPNLPGEKNRIMFNTREDAINASYKACGNCYP